MTYLELINKVLARLRETVVTTANENTYSSLIGALVNDAKKQVESSVEWTALNSQLSIATVASTATYSLLGTDQSSIIKRGMNTDANKYLTQQNFIWYTQKTELAASTTTGSPTDFVLNGVDASGQLKVNLYPTPDATQTIKFDCVIHQADLDADATRLLVPAQPVLQLAYAMALRERGETGGQSAVEQFLVAEQSLSDAISIDAARQPGELDFFRA